MFASRMLMAVVSLLLVCPVWGQEPQLQSHYIEMDDGVRIAVDVYLPEGHVSGTQYPALLELTRYWRAMIDPESGKVIRALSPTDRGFLKRDYAIVKVDVRGSGASFGFRPDEYGPREVQDGYAIVDWVAQQDWCDGNVGAFGISYSGTTAEFLAASKHPALKAVVPGWSDFDLYMSPGRPYGLVPTGFIDLWSEMVGYMDDNDVENMGGMVRPVDPDLLEAAVQEHARNPIVAEVERNMEFRDVGYKESSPLAHCASEYWKADIEASGVPMLVFASWLDAGTADGALLRFQNYSNRQYVVILASSHGGMFHGSPYAVSASTVPPIPSLQDQFNMRLAFFDYYLKQQKNEVENWPPIQYFNMGDEVMRTSDRWPPAGVKLQELFCGEDNRLVLDRPETSPAMDEYEVDFDVNTGRNNRWATQMGQPVLRLDHREEMDARMLCYTTDPLPDGLQLTGSALVTLWMSTTGTDGAVLAYLEDVAPDGQSRYLSEGGLRFKHRRPVATPSLVGDHFGHTFAQIDAMPVAANDPMMVQFRMWPVAARIPPGHRLRLAIAGNDSQVFERLPAGDEPIVYRIFRDDIHASSIQLPLEPIQTADE